jgi:hypothetical protein
MNAVIALLIVVLVFAVAIVAVLVALALHIHAEERQMSLTQPPRTRAGTLARRILATHTTPNRNARRTRTHTGRW